MTTANQAFMETMQTTIIGNVESATKYEIESGQKGGSIWVTKPTTGSNPNVLGNEIMKIRMPFEMFESLKRKHEEGEIKFPQVMEILCQIDMGGGNRAVLTAISIRKYIPETPETRPSTNQGKPEPKANAA